MFVFALKRWGVWCLVVSVAVTVLAGCGPEKPAGADGPVVSPEQRRQLEQLNAAADDMYRHTMDGNVSKARERLDEIGTKVTGMSFAGIASVEGLTALSESIVEAKRVFQAVQYVPESGQAAAAKIRLATDALTHANEPMWLAHYKGMKESADRLEQAVGKRNQREAAASLDELQFRYAVIRPSVWISRTPSQAEKLESLLAFLRKQLSQPQINESELGGALAHLQQTLDELFGRKEQAAYVPMIESRLPVRWLLLFGSMIVGVLAFAAWRIFDFERNSFGGGNKGGGW